MVHRRIVDCLHQGQDVGRVDEVKVNVVGGLDMHKSGSRRLPIE